VQAAEAALKVIQTQIDELTITAPATGIIEALDLRPGDLVTANAPVLTLMDTSTLWVRAYVPEGHLNLAKIGRVVPITIDSLPDKKFKGEITFQSPQAEFTPRNVQTIEERSKQVFRIKVTLKDGLDVLRPGMIGDVWLGQ
jgi:multidrug resistance efflux pump